MPFLSTLNQVDYGYVPVTFAVYFCLCFQALQEITVRQSSTSAVG